MFTLIFLFFLSIVFVVIAYLIRFKKRYDLIAGYSDYNKNGEENVKFKANLIADSTFFFSALLIVLSVFNFFVDWFKLVEDLDGMFIILTSLVIAGLFCALLYFYRQSHYKNKKS